MIASIARELVTAMIVFTNINPQTPTPSTFSLIPHSLSSTPSPSSQTYSFQYLTRATHHAPAGLVYLLSLTHLPNLDIGVESSLKPR